MVCSCHALMNRHKPHPFTIRALITTDVRSAGRRLEAIGVATIGGDSDILPKQTSELLQFHIRPARDPR